MKYDNTTTQRITQGIKRIGCITALGMVFTFALTPTAHAQIGIFERACRLGDVWSVGDFASATHQSPHY